MPRGYMEGPASEEAERRAEELARGDREPPAPKLYPAVYGCTEDDPEPHFLGWLAHVDPDELFFEVAELPDAWIAEYLNVPLQEIGEKREDLRALAVF